MLEGAESSEQSSTSACRPPRASIDIPAARAYPAFLKGEPPMQLHLSTWPEVEAYLARSRGIVIPIGSTEQHGPNGLLGTDALCPEIIAREAGERAAGDPAELLIGPTFNVGIAQHHLGF